MKTFLGVHYPPIGRRDGIDAFMRAGYAGLSTIDCGFPIQPGAFYATRFTVGGEDNPADFYIDPIGAARRWYAALQNKWRLNPGAHCRIINNELDIETPAHGEQQALFYLEFMRVNDENTPAEKIGICSYAGGNPSDNAPYTLEERWRPMLPAIKYAGEHGHYVVLHIHSQHYAPLESETGQAISLRHRRSIAYWLNTAAHPECLITQPPRIIFNEVSNGVGGVEPDLNGYIQSVTWLDQQLRADPYNSLYMLLGLYQAGGAEPISAEAYARLAEYVAAQSDIIINPLPIENGSLIKRITALEAADDANQVMHAQMQAQLSDLLARVAELEQSPAPVVTSVWLIAQPPDIIEGSPVTLTWKSTNATTITSNFGADGLSGSKILTPDKTTEYIITAIGPQNSATARAIVMVNSQPNPVFTWRGVGVGDNQPLTQPVLSALEISGVNSVKLFTMPDPSQMMGAISTLRAKRPDMMIMARLFFSVNPGATFSPANFVAFCRNGLDAAYAYGVRYFEIHNEPNIADEGLGFNWQDGRQFGTWLQAVLDILRPQYPLGKWGYPGLSPQSNTLQFLNDSLNAAQACDWIGVHAYFRGAGSTGFGMTSLDGGYYWKRIRDRVSDKPLIITEFSCNAPEVNYAAKGNLYRQYFDLLKTETGMLGAFCFALSWPGSDPNREGWVYNNKITAIPAAVMGTI